MQWLKSRLDNLDLGQFGMLEAHIMPAPPSELQAIGSNPRAYLWPVQDAETQREMSGTPGYRNVLYGPLRVEIRQVYPAYEDDMEAFLGLVDTVRTTIRAFPVNFLFTDPLTNDGTEIVQIGRDDRGASGMRARFIQPRNISANMPVALTCQLDLLALEYFRA